MLASAAEFFFVAGWVAIKITGDHIPLFELLFARTAVSLCILIPLMKLRKDRFVAKAKGLMALRSVAGFSGMILVFYAVANMKIGDASTLSNTFPLFTAIIARIMLGETFDLKRFGFVIIGFAGVALMMKPGAGVFDLAAFAAIGCAVFSALAMVLVNKLHKTDSTMTIIFWFTAFSAVVSFPVMLTNFVVPSGYDWIVLIMLGVVTSLGQILQTKAYGLAPASLVAPFSYVSVILSYCVGITLFSELPQMWSIAGAMLTILGGIGVILIARHSDRGIKALSSGCGNR